MKIAKNSRQEMIIKLIRENNISTQDELTELVKKNGFDATQATCSRDIKELGIIKITLPNNTSVYHVLRERVILRREDFCRCSQILLCQFSQR